MATPTNIFIAYHAKDTEILDNLRTHLSPLERTEGVKIWYESMINAGEETLVEIHRAMSEANIILLLVSSDFIASDFCHDTIMSDAIVMHREGKVEVIPVIVRHCMWRKMPFSHLHELPVNGVHVTSGSWDTPDEPYTQIARELSKLISSRQANKQDVLNKKVRKRGRVLYRIPEKMQKDVAADCVIRIAPEDLPEKILKEALKGPDKAVIEDIRRIGKYMKVLLTDDSGENAFLVKSKSRIEQVVEEDDYTEWQYEVTPHKEGIHKLLLTISVTIIRDEFGKEYKDVIVLDKEIEIITNEVDEIYDWVKAKESSYLILVHSNVGQNQRNNTTESTSNTSVQVEGNKSNIISILRNHRRILSTILLFIFFIPAITWAVEPSFVTPVVLNVRYDETRELSNDRIAVKKGDKWGIVNKWGITSEAPAYERIKDYENDIIQVKKDGKWGALEKTERVDDAWMKRVFSPKDEIVIPIVADTIEMIIDKEATLRIGTEVMILPVLTTDTIQLDKAEKETQLQVQNIYQAIEDSDFDKVSNLIKNINILKSDKQINRIIQEIDTSANTINANTEYAGEKEDSSKVEKATKEINNKVIPKVDTSKNILGDINSTDEDKKKYLGKIEKEQKGAENMAIQTVDTFQKIITDEYDNNKSSKNIESRHDFYIKKLQIINKHERILFDYYAVTNSPNNPEARVSLDYTIRSMDGKILKFLGGDLATLGNGRKVSRESESELPPHLPPTKYQVCAEINFNSKLPEIDTTNNLECIVMEIKSPVQKLFDNMIFVENQTLQNSFYIAKYEVTQSQWEVVMGNNPSRYKGCDRCPVENISWEDAQTFIAKLNQIEPDKKFRLPTDAEWEYAARGGKKGMGYKYAGSNDIKKVAWYDDSSGTKPVGQKISNELGIYDMSGNVYEWCENRYYGSLSSAARYVMRGGSWADGEGMCLISSSYGEKPDFHGSYCGFRVVFSY